MFRSLLRTIPAISGNFTLSCVLNEYVKQSNSQYACYINNAFLMPLDNKFMLHKDIYVNLVNAKYEYDVQRYFKLISDKFYKDTFTNPQDAPFTEYNKYDSLYNYTELTDDRDKNFEFGCKRIPNTKYNYQFQFFAPIYVNNRNDLPDYFVIDIINSNNIVIKKIYIPIGKQVGTNKLSIYLSKYLTKIEDNIPAYWDFNNNKIVYKNVIDCKNGGLINFTSYNIPINHSRQLLINEFDNLISIGYAKNNIIMGEVIPLSFVFNLEDVFDKNEKYYYEFNTFTISGKYIKNNATCDFYDFDHNYHYSNLYIKNFDAKTTNIKYTSYNVFDNNLNYTYKEGTNKSLLYENTLTHNYFKWKLYESEDYIINANAAYTSKYNRYYKFPILKNNIDKIYCKLANNNILLPLLAYANTNKYFSYSDIQQYEYLQNNYISDWFDIFTTDNTESDSNIFNNADNWTATSHNGNVFHKGILYSNIGNDVDYFGVFVTPKYVNWSNNIVYGDIIINDKKYDDITNTKVSDVDYGKYFEKVSIDDVTEDDDIYIYENISNTKKYIKYDKTNNKVINKIKENINNQFSNKVNISDKLNIINNIEEYLVIYDDQYEKIKSLTNENIIDNDNQNILLNNEYSILLNSLYYSKNNSLEKIQLKSYFSDYNVNEFKNENFSFFIKSNFIQIYSENDILNIFYDLGQELNQYILDIYKVVNDNNRKEYDEAIQLYNLLISKGRLSDISKLIKTRYISGALSKNDSIYINIILKVYTYILVYEALTSIMKNFALYYYVPYYNDNNLYIDYNYFEKINNDEKYNIYIDSYNLSKYLKENLDNVSINKSLFDSKKVYIKILDDNMLKIFIDKYYKENDIIENVNNNIIDNIYCYWGVLDNTTYEIRYYIKSIKEYIKSKSNYTYDNDAIKKILKQHTLYNSKTDEFTIDASFNNTDSSMSVILTAKLLYQKNVYVVNEYLYNYTLKKNIPVYIYHELMNTDIEKTLYKDSSYYGEEIHNIVIPFTANMYVSELYNINQNHIKNNIISVTQNTKKYYVYYNPKNIFYKTDLATYNEKYTNYDVYKISPINTSTINVLEHINDNGKKYKYINIEYTFNLSSNSFNIYYVDENDNVKIDKIQNNNIDDSVIYDNFKYIYPYLKTDLLIDNYYLLKSYIIFPTNVNLIIDLNAKETTQNNITYSVLNTMSNPISIYINRYFGNIMPLFNKVKSVINNQYVSLFKLNTEQNKQNSDKLKIRLTDINIYKYLPIQYIENINDLTNTKTVYQMEYKHFNNNFVYCLPTHLEFSPDDIDSISINNIKYYETREKCYEYFKKLIKKTYYNNKLDETKLLFLFNKYVINSGDIVFEKNYINYNSLYKQKFYKIVYKLTLR